MEENVIFKEINENFSLCDKHKNQFDFILDEDKILETINLDDDIISDKIKNIKIDTNN